MYLRKFEVKNIRSVDNFLMNFDHPAGWHVIIGDNGSGKSTIIRSIALGLVGTNEISGIQPNWNDWLKWGQDKGFISLELKNAFPTNKLKSDQSFDLKIQFDRLNGKVYPNHALNSALNERREFWENHEMFSAGYGPFRRFTGGNTEKEKIFQNPSFQKLASHLSLFGEDVALTETTQWLMNLKFQTYENKISDKVLQNIKKLINSENFLPHETKLIEISSEGVLFEDGNKAKITVTQMSDGYRSILSLTFELIRQLIRTFGEEIVFEEIEKGKMCINTPGIVLIDEVDAHLHPTWQTTIGKWFLQYFPKIQFIVSTHSPLVCRSSEKGSIWRLAVPGSGNDSGEITGIDRERIIYGDILDAYGTEIFGQSPVRSEKTDQRKKRLGELNFLKALGKINSKEEDERNKLLKIHSLS